MNKTDFSERLKVNGLKCTKHRLMILEMLDKSSQPISAEQLFNVLQSKKIAINLSTVYRTLEVLCDKNLLNKLNIDNDNRTLFEINRMIHTHYLICLGCKKIISINHCPLEGYESKLAKETGYEIAGHKLDIYGYCPECRRRLSAGEAI